MKNVIEDFARHYQLIFFSLLTILFILPLIIFQGNSYITIHDNLDGNIPQLVVLINSGEIFNYQGVIYQVMNGLPRTVLPTAFNIPTLLYWLFPPLSAYIINNSLVHIMAFVGMYLLLRFHVLKDDNLVASGVAFCFSFVPFYTIFGLSIAGLPLLLYAILNLRKKVNWYAGYLIIIFYALYSSFVQIGLFVLISLSIWMLIDAIRKKPIPGLFLPTCLLGISYFFIEINLIYSIFGPLKTISHRADWINWATYRSITLSESIKLSFDNFLNGQYHAVSLHKFILLIMVPAAYFVNRRNQSVSRKITILIIIAFIISITYGFSDWNGFLLLKEEIKEISLIQLRFYWLSPLVWYMIFALSLDAVFKSNIWRNQKIAIIFTGFLLLGQILFIGSNSPELINTISKAFDSETGRNSGLITYDQFYSQKLFSSIRDKIGKPQSSYRVISIGLFPALSQYNGFYTLDSYHSSYLLSYKKQFRKIIESELEKNEKWRLYFDSWGSRCYVFVDESDFSVTKEKSKPIYNLKLNSSILRELIFDKDLYIFSSSKIVNFSENGFHYIGYFEDYESPWGIYLYKLQD